MSKKLVTKVFTAHVPLALAAKVDEFSKKQERSRGWIVKQALSFWVTNEAEKDAMIQESLADMEAGRVVDHESIVGWAEGLRTERLKALKNNEKKTPMVRTRKAKSP